MRARATLLGLVFVAGAAAAQQLYRWTDEKGGVHITDTPPPASAKEVQKKKPVANTGVESQQPFEITQAAKDFPVTLYTSPNCRQPCDLARSALNRRAVPFKEVQVWEEKSNAELKAVSGATEVPTLVVGRSVHRGFEQSSYDALLDSARYPKAGLLPPRAQAAPPTPEGYVNERPSAPPSAEPVQPEAAPAPSGPYAPKPPRPQTK